jgi:hypothetical protein
VSAGCAFLWAADLYDGYRCWFRLAGLTVVVILAWDALRSAKCAAWLVAGPRGEADRDGLDLRWRPARSSTE